MNYQEIALEAALKAGEILKANFLTQAIVDGKGKHDIIIF